MISQGWSSFIFWGLFLRKIRYFCEFFLACKISMFKTLYIYFIIDNVYWTMHIHSLIHNSFTISAKKSILCISILWKVRFLCSVILWRGRFFKCSFVMGPFIHCGILWRDLFIQLQILLWSTPVSLEYIAIEAQHYYIYIYIYI